MENIAQSYASEIHQDHSPISSTTTTHHKTLISTMGSTIVTATTPTGAVITASSSGASIYIDESILDDAGEDSEVETQVFSCVICGQTRPDRQSLDKHMGTHSDDEDDMYQCSTCGDHFKQLVEMIEHSKTHSRRRMYKCCGKSFNKFTDLKTHMKQHSRDGTMPAATVLNGDEIVSTLVSPPPAVLPQTPPIVSPVIDTSMVSTPNSTTSAKRYPCNICGKSFAYDRNLKSHTRIHTGQRLLKCEHCDKQFVSPSDLKRHALIHIKPYACKQCGRRYAQMAKVRDHIERAHQGIGEHMYISSAVPVYTSTTSEDVPTIINTSASTSSESGVSPISETVMLTPNTSPEAIEKKLPSTQIVTIPLNIPLTASGYKGHYIKKPEGLVPTTDVAVSNIAPVSTTQADSVKGYSRVILQSVNQLNQSVGITYHGNDKYIVLPSGTNLSNLKDLAVMTTSTGQQVLSTADGRRVVQTPSVTDISAGQLVLTSPQSVLSIGMKSSLARDTSVDTTLDDLPTTKTSTDFGDSVMDQPVTEFSDDSLIKSESNTSLMSDWNRSYAAGTAMLDLSQPFISDHGDTDGHLLTPSWQSASPTAPGSLLSTCLSPPHTMKSTETTASHISSVPVSTHNVTNTNTFQQPTITKSPIINTMLNKSPKSKPTKVKPHMAEANSSPKERPHACATCGARFAQKAYLDNHLRTHTGEKPYKCEICGKKYGHNGTLYRHRKKHENGKNICCPKCNTPFANKKDLDEHHCSKAVDKRYKCATCGESFMYVGSLKAHMRTHPTVQLQNTTLPMQTNKVTVKTLKYPSSANLSGTQTVTMVPVSNAGGLVQLTSASNLAGTSAISIQSSTDILHQDASVEIANDIAISAELQRQSGGPDFSDSANLIDYAMSFSELELSNAVEQVACDLYDEDDDPVISLSPNRHHAIQPFRFQQPGVVAAVQQHTLPTVMALATAPNQTRRIVSTVAPAASLSLPQLRASIQQPSIIQSTLPQSHVQQLLQTPQGQQYLKVVGSNTLCSQATMVITTPVFTQAATNLSYVTTLSNPTLAQNTQHATVQPTTAPAVLQSAVGPHQTFVNMVPTESVQDGQTSVMMLQTPVNSNQLTLTDVPATTDVSVSTSTYQINDPNVAASTHHNFIVNGNIISVPKEHLLHQSLVTGSVPQIPLSNQTMTEMQQTTSVQLTPSTGSSSLLEVPNVQVSSVNVDTKVVSSHDSDSTYETSALQSRLQLDQSDHSEVIEVPSAIKSEDVRPKAMLYRSPIPENTLQISLPTNFNSLAPYTRAVPSDNIDATVISIDSVKLKEEETVEVTCDMTSSSNASTASVINQFVQGNKLHVNTIKMESSPPNKAIRLDFDHIALTTDVKGGVSNSLEEKFAETLEDKFAETSIKKSTDDNEFIKDEEGETHPCSQSAKAYNTSEPLTVQERPQNRKRRSTNTANEGKYVNNKRTANRVTRAEVVRGMDVPPGEPLKKNSKKEVRIKKIIDLPPTTKGRVLRKRVHPK